MLSKLLVAGLFIFGLTSCLVMPDGTQQPDYELIEIGALASMAVLVNETEIPDAKLVATHDRLLALHNTLICTENCPPFDLVMLEAMIMGSLPLEYQALGLASIRLIKSRAQLYLDPTLPDLENAAVIRRISASVVLGMVQAMAPQVQSIRG
jgi:hypothetical protein